MRRLIVAFIFLVATGQAARASFDDNDCAVPRWSLRGAGYDDCNNLPFLTPGNDTRVNLSLLIARQGVATAPEGGHTTLNLHPDDQLYGYGSVPFTIEALVDGKGGGEPNVETSDDASTKAWSTVAAKLGLTLPEGFPAHSSLPVNDLSEGQGSRCRSNTPETALAFVKELASDNALSEDERRKLAGARLSLLQTCAPTEEQISALVPAAISSPDGRLYADYLTGAAAFYGGDFKQATARFTALETAPRTWIAETARYMVARTALNNAQVNAFNEWGEREEKGLDASAIKAAENAFTAYLSAYPNGRYASSARGLMRKVYWLKSDNEMLASAYADVLAHPADSSSRLDLISEIDSKFVMDDPIPYGVDGASVPQDQPPHGAERANLLAMLDLMWMRSGSEGEDGKKRLDLNSLKAQRPVFVSRPELYDVLVASYDFYVAQQPDETLKHLPPVDLDAAKGLDYVRFSSAMLRGLALEATSNHERALSHWTTLVRTVKEPLQRVTVELALALNQSRAGRVDEIFVANSPIQQSEIRGVVLSRLAGPALLRRQAKAADVPAEERATAAFVLLYKDLMRGHYGDFADDFANFGTDDAKLPPPQDPLGAPGMEEVLGWFSAPLTDGSVAPNLGYPCPELKSVAAQLASNAKNAKALNCLGEFIRLHDLESVPIDQPLEADQLGAGPSQFDGTAFSRLDGYITVISDQKAPAADRAFALYRAIYCFASSGNNHCGGQQDVPKQQRKAWFQALKTQYGATPWAKDLKYYW